MRWNKRFVRAIAARGDHDVIQIGIDDALL